MSVMAILRQLTTGWLARHGEKAGPTHISGSGAELAEGYSELA